uniref:Uncharacterized protein n=1 Tax=Aegilops tauschii subsp. strangulata TaxID=200361 RepID=A0A453P7Y0_AEGTS
VRKYEGVLHALTHIFEQEGLRGLYRYNHLYTILQTYNVTGCKFVLHCKHANYRSTSLFPGV